jgi:hypothetical protein
VRTGGGGEVLAMDPDAVAKAFVDHYYQTFDTNRPALVGLYQETSMLTFEGHKFQGPAAIAGKLGSLPFQACQHKIDTVDCQPSGPQGGVLVFVSGSIRTGPEDHPLKFSQVCTSAWPRSSFPLVARLILLCLVVVRDDLSPDLIRCHSCDS